MQNPDLYIPGWLSRQNHRENKDKKIKRINLNLESITMMTYILSCMSVYVI